MGFITGLSEIARLCNWSPREIEGLREQLWKEIVRIDNQFFEVCKRTDDFYVANLVWEKQMEELRRWLSLILGIKIRYSI